LMTGQCKSYVEHCNEVRMNQPVSISQCSRTLLFGASGLPWLIPTYSNYSTQIILQLDRQKK
jgi:hypothetical protein